jgi:hypothetical protein
VADGSDDISLLNGKEIVTRDQRGRMKPGRRSIPCGRVDEQLAWIGGPAQVAGNQRHHGLAESLIVLVILDDYGRSSFALAYIREGKVHDNHIAPPSHDCVRYFW